MKNIIIFFLLPVALFSLSETVDNTSLYNKALGGPHSGMVAGFDSFFNNPALLGEYDSEFSFFELTTNLKGDSLELVNLYFNDELDIGDPAGLLATLDEKGLTSLLIGFDLNGPFAIGKIGKNWGWSLTNTSSVYLDLPGLISTADIIAREDLMLSLGVSIPMSMKFNNGFFMEFTPGLMSRTTVRGEMHIESDLLGLLGYVSDVSSLMSTFPIHVSPMFAIDAGFIFNVYDIVRLSGVIKDIYTPILKYPVTSLADVLSILTTSDDTTGNLIYREVNFGLSVDIPLGFLSVVMSDLNVYFDYFDLLEFNKNVLLHLGTGVDVELLDKFHLLAGINEGLLSLGLNLDLGGFEIGFAMYGSEESLQPGVRSSFNFLLSMGISF